MASGESSDFKAHEQTYGGFLALFKYGTIISFLVAAIVVLILKA